MSSQPELSAAFAGAYRGKRVLVTGHTGFKGSWLSEWLIALGADVSGLALEPATKPALFTQLGLAARMRHRIGDVREIDTVIQAVKEAQPDYVFHLAAQPLVRQSYLEPAETFATNCMGTVNVLEAVRRYQAELQLPSPSSSTAVRGARTGTEAGTGTRTETGTDRLNSSRRIAVVIVTTDKCYENHEDGRAYREGEAMGGHDPYSASKGAAEIIASSYRRSFFSGQECPIRVATARAGNVIGGGDWADDRILPDAMRALQGGRAIPVRNPASIRPWQHVLEPLGGYLWLGVRLAGLDEARGHGAADAAFNFGPADDASRTVADLVREVLKHWPGQWEDRSQPGQLHEAALLGLAIDKARAVLDWRPTLTFADTVATTVDWYRTVHKDPTAAHDVTQRQIAAYVRVAQRAGRAWAS